MARPEVLNHAHKHGGQIQTQTMSNATHASATEYTCICPFLDTGLYTTIQKPEGSKLNVEILSCSCVHKNNDEGLFFFVDNLNTRSLSCRCFD